MKQSKKHAGRAMVLTRRIKSELEKRLGRPLTYQEMGAICQESASTVFDRLQRKEQPQVDGFLCLVEALAEPVRNQMLQDHLRSLPCFADPRLSHDRAQIAHLRAVLEKPRGTTLVLGANDEARTTVVTALARESKGAMQGLDLHPPEWFVQAEGIRYQVRSLPPTQVCQWVCENWEVTKAPSVLFNGLWALLPPAIREKVVKLGLSHHLLIADSSEESLLRPKCFPNPVHFIRVVVSREGFIHANLQGVL